MTKTSSKCFFFFFILSLLTISSSGRFIGSNLEALSIEKDNAFKFYKLDQETMHDTVISPTTIFPTTPDTSTPTIVTVPATNPVTVTPANPASSPVSIPLTTPISVPATNPANVAPPITIPGAQPITNPVTTYPAPSSGVPVVTNPVPVAPPATTNAPVIPGQSWCVAKSGASATALQAAIDYACGMGAADCSQIQQSGNCYNPNSLENHASFAFNSYFQKNPSPTSCDFGGTAMITNSNPSSGSCIYPLSSTSSTPSSLTPPTPTPTPSVPTPTPTTPIPIPPTPTMSSPAGTGIPEYGTPPTVLNTSNPASSTGSTTGFGNEITPSSSTSISMAAGLRPFTFCITLMISLITRQIILKW